MSNARTEVAKRGWTLYRATFPRPSLAEINVQLEASGLEPVSARTLRHYKKLDRYQLSEYLPINELDIRTKAKVGGS